MDSGNFSWGIVGNAMTTSVFQPVVDTSCRRLWPVYFVEGMASLGANLLMVGIFFYTQARFGWGARQNLILAAAQGVAYILGALLADRLTRWLGRIPTLGMLHALMAVLAVTGWLAGSAFAVTAVLIGYTFLVAANWPVLEGLVSTGVDAHQLSRRIGLYNLVWSGVAAGTVAVNGAIIQYWPAGVFLLPLLVHCVAAGIILMPIPQSATPAAAAEEPGEGPEPRLLQMRTQALWLSRIGLPAVYIVTYALVAMMPSLPAIQSLGTTAKTLVGSVWLVARFGAFLLLGASVWWHIRPRVILAAAALLLAAFIGVTVPASHLAGHGGAWLDLTWMIGWQMLLGLAMGMIYCGSLYFGMVLSEGSTEHGGYHEALIGVGQVVGPAVGALVPGGLTGGITAVAGLTAMAVLAAAVTTIVLGRNDGRGISRETPDP
jgi:hypothetical protein